MAYWKWDSSYELGINTIDDQHKELVRYINELQAALTTRNREQIYKVLIGMTNYTISHFAFEEKLMEEAGYEMAEHHKKTHDLFVAIIQRYKSSFEEGYNITGQLMAEIQIWLTHHIAYDDNDYKECVKKMLEYKSSKQLKNKIVHEKKGWFSALFR
ncbi:MAG: bacteriohemerythrin [Campylobacteraceae bacterium]|jgi:hemerythrin|nr:bacteriohemerythrin [Campylobacteraceae bacterium]